MASSKFALIIPRFVCLGLLGFLFFGLQHGTVGNIDILNDNVKKISIYCWSNSTCREIQVLK